MLKNELGDYKNPSYFIFQHPFVCVTPPHLRGEKWRLYSALCLPNHLQLHPVRAGKEKALPPFVRISINPEYPLSVSDRICTDDPLSKARLSPVLHRQAEYNNSRKLIPTGRLPP